jgi:mannosyltransferase OCH1-like enzyme
MIPAVIHQIWIGPKQRPDEWMQSWRDKNPSFAFEVWDERAIDAFGLQNRDKYDYYMKKGIYDGAADVARVEILHRQGGIYIDADSVCLHTLEDAWFLSSNFFAAYEYDQRIANGVIGTVPRHGIMDMYLRRLTEATVLEPACFTIGGTLLTTCVDVYLAKNSAMVSDAALIKILPSFAFYPKLGHYREATSTIYARQMWGSTKKLYKDAV